MSMLTYAIADCHALIGIPMPVLVLVQMHAHNCMLTYMVWLVQVSLQQFENFARLRRDVHTLEVALEFYHNTVGHLRVDDFQRAAKKITGTDMGKDLIKVLFAIFDTDKDADLSPRELLQVMRRREGNSAYDTYSIERQDTGATGLFKCFIGCITRQTGS